MSENKKNLWLAIAGAGALIGAALLYHYASGTAEGEEVPSTEDLVADLKKEGLDDVQRQGSLIESRYFLKLLQFVGATTRDRTAPKRKQLTEERRKHYKSKDWKKYEDIVRSFIEVEDQAAQSLLKDVLEILRIQEQEFGMTHQRLASDPQYAEFVMAAQQGKLQQPSVGKQPSLTKQKTLEVLGHQEELTMK